MKTQPRKRTLVWGGLLILFGLMWLVETFTDLDLTAWAWVAILALAGLGAFAVYRTDRSERALLIAAYVMWAVAVMVALITLRILQDPFIAFYVLAAIALPFWVVFLRDREQRWALIPAYVLLAIAVTVVLIGLGVLSDLLIPTFVMFVIAIPFFVVYARDPKQWWALIPGGIMAVIGISFLIAEALFQYVAAVVLVVAGVWILVRQLTRREPATRDAPASTDSGADKPPPE